MHSKWKDDDKSYWEKKTKHLQHLYKTLQPVFHDFPGLCIEHLVW